MFFFQMNSFVYICLVSLIGSVYFLLKVCSSRSEKNWINDLGRHLHFFLTGSFKLTACFSLFISIQMEAYNICIFWSLNWFFRAFRKKLIPIGKKIIVSNWYDMIHIKYIVTVLKYKLFLGEDKNKCVNITAPPMWMKIYVFRRVMFKNGTNMLNMLYPWIDSVCHHTFFSLSLRLSLCVSLLLKYKTLHSIEYHLVICFLFYLYLMI